MRFSVNKGDLLLLAVAMVWGGSYLAVKELSAAGPWMTILALRFLLGAVFIGVFWLRDKPRITRKELWMGLGFGLSHLLVLSLETSGVSITSATNAGLIISLSIIFTPVLESAWRRSWLPPTFFVATVMAVVGMFLLITGNGFVQPNLGDVLVLAAALFRTIHVVAIGHLTQTSQSKQVEPVSPINLSLLQCVVAGTLSFLWNPGDVITAVQTYSLHDWLLMGYLSLFCTALGFVGLNWGIKHTSASRTSLLLGTEPVFATGIAVFLGGEAMGPVGVLGGAIIVAATYWGQAIEQRYRLAKSAT